MISRRSFAVGSALMGGDLLMPRLAAARSLSWPEFSWDVHGERHTAGVPIAMAFHADWCGTCMAQEPVFNELWQDERYYKFVWMRVDFDAQKDVAKKKTRRRWCWPIATKRSVGLWQRPTSRSSATCSWKLHRRGNPPWVPSRSPKRPGGLAALFFGDMPLWFGQESSRVIAPRP